MRNGFDQVDVRYFYGALVVNKNKSHTTQYKGATIGNVINGWGIDNDSDPMLYHEYGHTIQSRRHGPYYLYQAAVSLFSASKDDENYNHNFHPIERQANRFAKSYFGEDLWNKMMKAGTKESQLENYPTY